MTLIFNQLTACCSLVGFLLGLVLPPRSRETSSGDSSVNPSSLADELLFPSEYHSRARREVAAIAGERYRADPQGGTGGDSVATAARHHEPAAPCARPENRVEVRSVELLNVLSYLVPRFLHSAHILFPKRRGECEVLTS